MPGFPVHYLPELEVNPALKLRLILYEFNCAYIYAPEKAMAPHSSTLTWKIPWTEEPGGL